MIWWYDEGLTYSGLEQNVPYLEHRYYHCHYYDYRHYHCHHYDFHHCRHFHYHYHWNIISIAIIIIFIWVGLSLVGSVITIIIIIIILLLFFSATALEVTVQGDLPRVSEAFFSDDLCMAVVLFSMNVQSDFASECAIENRDTCCAYIFDTVDLAKLGASKCDSLFHYYISDTIDLAKFGTSKHDCTFHWNHGNWKKPREYPIFIVNE